VIQRRTGRGLAGGESGTDDVVSVRAVEALV